MNLTPWKKKELAPRDEGPFRDIQINLTRFKAPCDVCKKVAIIAGWPDKIQVRVRMTDEEFNIVAQHPFYVNPHHKFDCHGGISHTLRKDFKPTEWIISDQPEWGGKLDKRTGIVESGSHFERVLSDFIPRFVHKIVQNQIPKSGLHYVESPTFTELVEKGLV